MGLETAQFNLQHAVDQAKATVEGNPVDQLAEQNDAIDFEFADDETNFMRGKDGDLLAITRPMFHGTLTLRVKPSSRFLRDVVPTLRGRQFAATYKDKNGPTRFTVKTQFGFLIRYPQQQRGAPDLNVVEVQIGGAWELASG